MRYSVNVDVALRRGGEWLLIVRGLKEEHAAGTLSLVGGTVDAETPGGDVITDTARREVLEEIGVDLDGVELSYAESSFFVTDTGSPVINVVLAGELPEGAQPVIASPEEVADIRWESLPALELDATCPPWTLRSVQQATAALGRASAAA
ncbi:NUDIX domain-containing protein [Streptomyces sp. NPDC018352]|uniref:NUDIX hydrolase n=1 Tax=Streptomyces sp. NPDC018352 TaxID=3157194 RepID=UPI0033FD000A